MKKFYGENELRRMYLEFFESKGHLAMKSFSLVPHNDNSLLLINAGMAPLKPYFTGQEIPPRRRVTTCQKCIRTGDIENVGKTARHLTFFEMLGNFSFGDYFKHEAIAWSWEFLTKVLGLEEDRLYPSIYGEDEEAYEIWTKEVGVPGEKITRFYRDPETGECDNFWEHGAGPCGPCSEIYYDRGEKYGCGSPDCKVGCDCDRFMEVWNNVFTQFEGDGKGGYTELSQKNIDTGMGLERLAVVMQDVDSVFDIDTMKAIRDKICEMSGKKYEVDAMDDVSIRLITDHIRSSTFLVSDGVMPSNEGRGYVLRRLIRRAARHGKMLGIDGLFLAKLSETVINESKDGYPELEEKKEFIFKVLTNEENQFNKTIDQGLRILGEMEDEMKAAGEKTLSGENAFKLYDTYGFPMDLTKEILEEKGYDIVPEIMIPLVGEKKELAYVKEVVVQTAEKVKAYYESDIKYKVGTMIEIPRAALLADEIAEEAEFFSFGTNDLTQMTFGFSRDDAGKFLESYYENKIYESDPFAKLDQKGVGQLIEMAAKKGKATRPDIHLGICGEHGGEPSSVIFCDKVGMDYVSCSPFRVPIARLAAAQAAIMHKK